MSDYIEHSLKAQAEQLQRDSVHKALSTTLDSTTCSIDGKSLRHPLRRLHKLRTPLGEKLRASNLRIWRNTTLPSTATRNFQKQTYECRNAFGSERFLKPETTMSQQKQAYRKYEQYGDYRWTSNTTSRYSTKLPAHLGRHDGTTTTRHSWMSSLLAM